MKKSLERTTAIEKPLPTVKERAALLIKLAKTNQDLKKNQQKKDHEAQLLAAEDDEELRYRSGISQFLPWS